MGCMSSTSEQSTPSKSAKQIALVKKWMDKVPSDDINTEFRDELLTKDCGFESDAFEHMGVDSPNAYADMMHNGIFSALPDFAMEFPVAFAGTNEEGEEFVALLEKGTAHFTAELYGETPTGKLLSWTCPWFFHIDAETQKIKFITKGFDFGKVCRDAGWPAEFVFPPKK